MNDQGVEKNLRILVIDDNRSIHADFRKILCPVQERGESLKDTEALLFDQAAPGRSRAAFEIASAFQGQEGVALAQQALDNGRPYAMAFVDVRMPPGWDGVETTARLWEICPDMQIVICTAYSDYSWDEMVARLNNSDRLVILKKPFDAVEVLQLASSLTEKWRLQQQVRLKLEQLEKLVQERTGTLQQTNAKLQTEILQRHRAAEALRESEERYQLLFWRNPLSMWVIDMATLGILAVNETAVNEYGYSIEDFLSMTLKELHPADEIEKLLQKMALADDEDSTPVVTTHRKKSGEVIDVEVVSRMIVFARREARLILANDITERKRAEDRIRQQAMLLDLAHDAIFVRDLEGYVRFWNKGAEALYGVKAADAVGAPFYKVFSRDEMDTFASAEKILLEKGEWGGEVRRQNKSGQEVIVSSRWTLLRDEAGNPRSVLAINTDITEKKKLEAQFLRAQRMEGIGTLATGMAHDLNNILAPILMSAGALRWDLTPEERETAIARIEMSVRRGADIIQQVLTFGRGVTGDRVSVNPVDLMEEICKIISQTFPKDINIVFNGGGVWPIIGDKTQIHQVLLNLCINARDAMPKGGTLSLEAQNISVDEPFASLHGPLKPGPHVQLQVTDTGCGIPQSDIERIFDPFFTTKEFGKGTGLGLSTVIGIVKSHHGLVTVESELNHGTTFKVLLPASPIAAKKSAAAGTIALPRGQGEAILIVDDESSIVAATRKMLEQSGYVVLVANGSEEALEIFSSRTQNIELVVTDIMMPGMDGVGLIHALKEIDPDVRVIASSGLRRDMGVGFRASELDSLGVKGFLAKPYTAQKLLTVLREALTEKAAVNK